MAPSNLARGNSVNDSVKERRLRPLYDLLDSGNCKKVLQEADKLLKKHPTFSCAKIIKALAYMRLGKMDECMSIMKQVLEEVPTDEATLHAMSICYRELDMPERVCILYENACKVDKSEEHMTSWYMSHVRILDFPNQHKVAMQLYKTYSKGTYLLWAVMSLYCKALILDEPNIADSITLPLAARMVSKYIDENPLVHTETDVYLHIMVLFKMNDYRTALSVLHGAREKVKSWTYAQYSRLEMTCLMKLNNPENLVAAFERNILHDPSDFKTFRQYIDAFGLTRTDQLIDFFKGIAYDIKLKGKSRTALLALIVLAERLLRNNLKPESIEIRQLFIEYFTTYGAKPFFIRDMKIIFKQLKDLNDAAIITSTMEEDMNSAHNSRDLATIVQWKTNFECVRCVLNQSEILSDQANVINAIASNVAIYQSLALRYKSVRSKADSRDNCPYEELLSHCSLLLMKTFWNKQGFWTGYYLNSSMKSLNVEGTGLKPDHLVENGLLPASSSSSPIKKSGWFEGEFPIVLNMALLEFGALSSPYFYPYRLLLGKTYLFCGAAEAGLDQLMKMDIKHMQIESLGYLYLPKALWSGVLTDARRVMIHADSFYSTCNKELMEHVISAYKNLSWHQVLEFMGFRETMLKSVQASQIKVEKRLFEYTMDGINREQILKVAQRECFEVESAFTTPYEDNRDFGIHSFMYESVATEEYRELTFHDILDKLQLRASVLGMITNFVRALSNLNDSNKFRAQIGKAKCAFDALSQCMNNLPKEHTANVEDRCLFGPWPPTTHEYTESQMVSCLQEFLSLVMVAGSLCCKENSQEDIKNLYTVMDVSSKQLLETVKLYLNEWEKIDISLINMSNLNEELFLVVETLGFISILVDVLKGFLEKMIPTTSETKGKKKKSKDNAVDFPWITQYNSLVANVLACESLVEAKLVTLEIASAAWFPETWSDEQQIFWKGKVPENLLLVLKETLPIVWGKLTSSFRRAFSEMKTTISSKMQLVESLMVNIN